MRPSTPHNHRQHCAMQPLTPISAEPVTKRYGIVIAMLLCLVLLLGLAQHWDERAAQLDRESQQRVADQVLKTQIEREWLHRMASAYAQGQIDALDVEPGSPEATRLVQVCQALPSSDRARP